MKSWKTYAGLAIFAADWATHHVLDVALAPLLAVFGSLTLDDLVAAWWLGSLGELDAAWRGYKAPKKGKPYEGEGYPDSSTTYAVENLRGAYKEGPLRGWVKKTASVGVLAGTLATDIIGSAWEGAFQGIRAVRDLKSVYVPEWLIDLGRVPAGFAAFAGGAIVGGAKRLWKWCGEFVDGFKMKSPKSVSP